MNILTLLLQTIRKIVVSRRKYKYDDSSRKLLYIANGGRPIDYYWVCLLF